MNIFSDKAFVPEDIPHGHLLFFRTSLLASRWRLRLEPYGRVEPFATHFLHPKGTLLMKAEGRAARAPDRSAREHAA